MRWEVNDCSYIPVFLICLHMFQKQSPYSQIPQHIFQNCTHFANHDTVYCEMQNINLNFTKKEIFTRKFHPHSPCEFHTTNHVFHTTMINWEDICYRVYADGVAIENYLLIYFTFIVCVVKKKKVNEWMNEQKPLGWQTNTVKNISQFLKKTMLDLSFNFLLVRACCVVCTRNVITCKFLLTTWSVCVNIFNLSPF